MKITAKNELSNRACDWVKAKHLFNRAGFGGKPTDFLSVYATVLDDWLCINSGNILGKKFEKVPIV